MLVAESGMDKDRAREQKRASATRAAFVRRQHRLLSSVHLRGCNGKRHNLSGPGVPGCGEDTGDGSPADSGGCSSNDDGGGLSGDRCRYGDGDKEPRTPPIASTSSSSKKRVMPNGKVSDGYAGVDPAAVPRKLRSAMTKRVSGSLSPSFPCARKKDHLASISGSWLPFSRTVEVTGSLTKDEEDAVETLSALAQMVTDCTPTQVCVDGIPKPEKSDSKASTSANVEVPGGSTGDLYCSEKLLEDPEGSVPVTEFDLSKHTTPVVNKEHRKLDSELNRLAEVDTKEFDHMKINNNTVDLNDTFDLSATDSAETVPQLFLGNGVVEPSRKAPLPPKPDNAVGLLECSSGTLNLDSKCQENIDRVTHLTCREDPSLGTRVVLPVAAGGQSDAGCCSSQPSSSRADTPAEKTLMLSGGRRHTWKRCATHVCIGYLIRHCQMTDGKNHTPTPCNKRPKLEPLAVTNEVSRHRNGVRNLSAKETENYIVDRKPYEMKPGPLHDKEQKPFQQLQSIPGVYTQPKQNCELLTLSPGSEFLNSGSKMDSAAKFSSTNLTSVAAPHSLVSFSLPAPYSSPYPDQLAAQAAAQQLPQYLATPFYGFHMGHMGGPAKQQLQQPLQQQQLWQAQVTQYWMPPVLPKWQNGRPLDPSQSLIPGAQIQPVLIHPAKVEAKGVVASYHRPASIPHQMLPIPLQASNRPK